MAILLVISAAALYGLVVYQKNYVGTSMHQGMESSIRSASELLQQEIGQAGSVSGVAFTTPPALHTAVAKNSISAVTLCLGSNCTTSTTVGLYQGESVVIDYGTGTQETVTLGAVTSTTISIPAPGFQQAHAIGATVTASGVIYQGASVTGGNTLTLFGDINSDGNMYYVQYVCTQSSTAPNYGTLTRTITPVSAGSLSTTDTLVQGVTTNPDGSNCFTSTTQTVTAASTVCSAGCTFTTSVGLTLTTYSTQMDPQKNCAAASTNKNCLAIVTNSFLNLTPRNILYAYNQAKSGSYGILQTTNPPIP